MTTFLEYYNVDLLEVIQSDIPSLFHAFGKFLPRNTWSDE